MGVLVVIGSGLLIGGALGMLVGSLAVTVPVAVSWFGWVRDHLK